MPTNKLWLEHTEQAAWQSVEALREKLALAEQRQARLAPPVEGWQSLLDALDLAKNEHAVSGESYAAIVRALLERLSVLSAQARAVEQAKVRVTEVEPMTAVVGASSRASRARSLSLDDEEREPDAPAPGESRLFREIRDRYGRLTRARGRDDAPGLLADIEARLDDLPDLDPAELCEVAADLGALALLVTRGGHSDD